MVILSFLLRTFTFRKAHLSRSYIDPATLYALMNINKPKLRGVMYTLFFFNKTSCSYSMFGTSTKVTFHCIKRKHIVFKLTLTADKCRFPQRGLLLRRRVYSRRGSAQKDVRRKCNYSPPLHFMRLNTASCSASKAARGLSNCYQCF